MGKCGSNLLSGAGFAQLRGQAQVVAALESSFDSRGAACATGGFELEPARPETAPVDRAEKKEAVTALNEVFSKTSVVVVAHYSGLTVAQMQRLRKQMKAGWRERPGRQEPPRPDCSSRHGRRLDRSLAQGADPDRPFERSGGGGQGSRGFRQGSREVRAPGRRHGQDGPRRRRGQGARDLAVPRRAARQTLGLITAPATKLAQLATAPAAKLARVVGAYAAKDAA